jgi:hypothetical protein
VDHIPWDRQIPGEPGPPGCLVGEWGVRQLRWVRCPDEGRLHLLGPVEVVVAATGGQAEALCGRALPPQCLPLVHSSSRAVCMACVDGIPWPTRSTR